MKVVTIKECGTLVRYVWIEGALLRLEDLSSVTECVQPAPYGGLKILPMKPAAKIFLS
jgi:hypothetical protein